jgi:hypothetical protein
MVRTIENILRKFKFWKNTIIIQIIIIKISALENH